MESLVGLGALKTCPPSSMSSRRIMPTSVSVGCLWRSTDFTAMGSWEMFVIPQKLFFFTGTRLLGVNTPVPDLPSIFTTPAPVSGRLREPAFVYILRPGTLLITVADIPFLVHPPTCTQMILGAVHACVLCACGCLPGPLSCRTHTCLLGQFLDPLQRTDPLIINLARHVVFGLDCHSAEDLG